MRLLVIEDDITLRETLCSQLAEAGFGVEQAADGREGLYFALEYPIDLAIVDLGLPEISGLDLIRELREKGKTYPILILTARDRWQDKVEGARSPRRAWHEDQRRGLPDKTWYRVPEENIVGLNHGVPKNTASCGRHLAISGVLISINTIL